MSSKQVTGEYDPFAGPRLDGVGEKSLAQNLVTDWARGSPGASDMVRVDIAIEGAFDSQRLQESMNAAVREFEGLCRFISMSGDWTANSAVATASFRQVEAAHDPAAGTNLDPENGPLLSVILSDDGQDESCVTLFAHAAVCDEAGAVFLLFDIIRRSRGDCSPVQISPVGEIPSKSRSCELRPGLAFASGEAGEETSKPAALRIDLRPGTLAPLHGSGSHKMLLQAWAAYLGVLNAYEDYDLVYSATAAEPGATPNALCVRRISIRPDDSFDVLMGRTSVADAEYLEPGSEPDGAVVSVQPNILLSDRNFTVRSMPAGSSMHVRVGQCGASEWIECDYLPAQISGQVVSRRLGEFAVFLEAVSRCPDRPISTINLLSEDRKQELNELSRGPSLRVPDGTSAVSLIEERVARQPGAVAICFDDQQLSYAQLWSAVQGCAAQLSANGVEDGARVAVLLEQSPEYIISILALSLLGCTYVPLDPKQPPTRLAYICEDSGVSAVIVSRAATLPSDQLPRRIVFEELAGSEVVEARQTGAPAYVLYTSGSTGNPKGVAISQSALLHHNCAILKDFGICATDHVLQFANPVFDVAVEEIFPTLIAGATVVLMPDKAQLSMAEFDGFVRESGISILNLPANYWHEWVRYLQSNDLHIPADVRLVVAGSDRVSPDIFRLWAKIAPTQVGFRNGYGPTECTVTATLFNPREHGSAGDTVPIGRPVANMQAMVVRGDMPAPLGVRGELLLGGPQLADGYFGRQDLNEAVFVDLDLNGSVRRWYRTGDEVRMLDDGNLEFIGRIDHQVKVNGFRVELGEVERVIESLDEVSRAVAAVSKNPAGIASLSAYYSTESGQEMPLASLRECASRLLPPYMVPTHWMWLAEMPSTASGKVDRKSLPEIETSRPELINPLVSPSNTLERQLTDIWKSELRLDTIGVLDNFFELGGTSMAGLRIIEAINRQQSSAITAAQFFQYPSVSRLADFLNEGGKTPESGDTLSRRGAAQRAAIRKNGKWQRRRAR